MNIKQCESFLKLAELGSFSRAAQDLFISKQGLSRTIRGLENELKAPLFLRTAYGTELSPEGKAILPEMTDIFRKYQSIQTKLKSSDHNELKVLFPDCFFACVSTDLMFSFLEKHKEIQFDYTCCCDSELEARFMEGDISLAVCSNPERKSKFNYFPLFRNYRCFAVHKDSPLAQKRFLGPKDLETVPIAVAPAEKYNDYQYLSRILSACTHTPKVFFCYSNESLLQFAAQNRGIALTVSSFLRGDWDPSLRYVFHEDYESSAYAVNVLTAQGKTLSAEARSFIRHMQEYCQQELKKWPNFPLDGHAPA